MPQTPSIPEKPDRKVQRSAARFVTNDFSYNSSVSSMFAQPKWPVTRKPDPPFLAPPGPNISKYLDPPDNIFQFC